MTPTPTHPSTIITKPIKKASALPCPERGLLWYMLDNVDSQGLFEQHIDVIAKSVGSTHATVWRWQDNLINLGYVEVVRKPTKRVNGKFMTAAILRPRPISTPKLVDSATQPVDSVNESTRGLGQGEESKDIQPSQTPQKRQLVDLVPPSPNGLLEALPIEERKNSTVYRLDSNSATCSTTTCMPVDSVVRDTQPPDIDPPNPPVASSHPPVASSPTTSSILHSHPSHLHTPPVASTFATQPFLDRSNKPSLDRPLDRERETGVFEELIGWKKDGVYSTGRMVVSTNQWFNPQHLPKCPECIQPCAYEDEGTEVEIFETCGSENCETQYIAKLEASL